jgi:hypothetical protein
MITAASPSIEAMRQMKTKKNATELPMTGVPSSGVPVAKQEARLAPIFKAN